MKEVSGEARRDSSKLLCEPRKRTRKKTKQQPAKKQWLLLKELILDAA